MLRSIIAVVVGVLVGAVVVYVAELIGHMVYPLPEGVDMKDPVARAAAMDQISLGAKIAVVVAWGLGVFVGALAALIIGQSHEGLAWIVAAALFFMALITLVQLPHALWMLAGAVLVTLLGVPAAVRIGVER